MANLPLPPLGGLPAPYAAVPLPGCLAGGDGLRVGGYFILEHVGADGVTKDITFAKNMIVTVALNDILNVYFRSSAASANWYVGLINLTSFSALAAADTMSSHAGWVEATTYTQATRVQWSPSAASSGVLSAAAMDFTFSAATTVHGLFVVNESTKGGTSGTLWATALADVDKVMAASETLRCYYVLTAQSN